MIPTANPFHPWRSKELLYILPSLFFATQVQTTYDTAVSRFLNVSLARGTWCFLALFVTAVLYLQFAVFHYYLAIYLESRSGQYPIQVALYGDVSSHGFVVSDGHVNSS
jgi:hypothetical protein